MEKKKRFSLLKALIMTICIISVVVSLAFNIAFSNDRVPNLFGRYIYIVDENANLGGKVTSGAALIAKEAESVTLQKGDIILCYPSEDPNNLRLRSINDIITSEDNIVKYTTSDAVHVDSSGSITKDKIIAICTGYPESIELGKFIAFTTSVKGLLIELVLPCVILVVFLIIAIFSSKNNEDEEEDNFDFYEYDEEEKIKESKKNSHVKTGTPLFEASQEIQPSNEFERKKMSIADNFSQKKVNPDSPYQKEKERTMQFKAQRSAETSFAARNMGGQSSTAPTADALREEMLRKTAEAERTGSFDIKATGGQNTASPVADNTGVLSKAQLAEMSRNNIPKTTPLRSQSAPYSGPVKKSDSPDIGDIIGRSDSSTRRKPASDMSVDDLLKLIENEKKKY